MEFEIVHEDDLEPKMEMVVSEDEALTHEDPHVLVVEEAGLPEIGEYVPGSNTMIVEEDEAKDHEEKKETDWENDADHAKFMDYFDKKVKNIPRHSGQTVLGCERAISFLKALLNELSKALRGDLDAKIDEQAAEDRYNDTQNMIDRLEHQVKKLKGTGKTAGTIDVNIISEGHCETCNSNVPVWHDVVNEEVVCLNCDASILSGDELVKTANTPKLNMFVTPFQRAIVGTIVNSVVSQGKNLNETYGVLKAKYKFTPREELEFFQILSDYGFGGISPTDRALLGEEQDPQSSTNPELASNYYA